MSAELKDRHFVQVTYSLGAVTKSDLDKALAVADAIEDEAIIRKAALQTQPFSNYCE